MRKKLPQRETVTVPEMAAMLGVSRVTAYHALRAGNIPSIRIGKKLVVSRRVLDEMLGVEMPPREAVKR